jgi:hypothetical protein
MGKHSRARLIGYLPFWGIILKLCDISCKKKDGQSQKGHKRVRFENYLAIFF